MNVWQQIKEITESDYRKFINSLASPEASQKAILLDIIKTNQTSTYGQKYHFDKISTVAAFQSRVPINKYSDIANDVELMLASNTKTLCADDIISFECTSGTTGKKIIPYTGKCLDSFREAINPWLYNLIDQFPQLSNGKLYWSISPQSGQLSYQNTPIGLDSELAYFGEELSPLIAKLWVLPEEVSTIRNIEDWCYLTLRCLLSEEKLTLFSVWSPTFLTTLMANLSRHGEQIISDIKDGTVTLPSELMPPVTIKFLANSQRARVIKQALTKTPIDTRLLWPQLKLISCWRDGVSSLYIPKLQELFPHALIQGKGLLATEGIISIPIAPNPWPVISINSAFYEFVDSNNKVLLAHQLKVGQIYKVLITTHGGLYRYSIGDLIQVKGWFFQTPMVEFIGRSTKESDICGEKLTEAQVVNALMNNKGFAMLTSNLEGQPHYVLNLDESEIGLDDANSLAKKVDNRLRTNPQYKYARDIKQLGRIKARRCYQPLISFLNWSLKRGQKLGDIKAPVLCDNADWLSQKISNNR